MHIRSHRTALALLVSLFSIPVSAPALVLTGDACRMYFVSEPNIPSTVRNLMTKYNVEAADVCISARGKVSFFSGLSTVRERPFGVCAFRRMTPVVPKNPAVAFPSEISMQIKTTICPRQDDPNFVETRGVSEGLFVLIDQFFRKALSSSSKFRSSVVLDADKAKEERLEALMTDIFDRGYSVRGIAITDPFVSDVLRGYQVGIESPKSQRRWVLVVDFTDQGIRVFDFFELR
jgi:hypothetical protein